MAKKKSRSLNVDFTDVEVGKGGGGFHIEEGPYRVRVESVEQDTSGSGNDMLAWIFKGIEGAAKGKTFYFYTVLQDNALWKLRETLEGLGVDVPDDAMDIDLDDLEGREGIGRIEDDVYEGKTRSKLVAVSATDEESEDEEEEEDDRPAKKAKKSNGKKAVKVSKEEVTEMDEEELENLVSKYDLELDLSDYKTPRKKVAAVLAALDEGDHLEA